MQASDAPFDWSTTKVSVKRDFTLTSLWNLLKGTAFAVELYSLSDGKYGTVIAPHRVWYTNPPIRDVNCARTTTTIRELRSDKYVVRIVPFFSVCQVMCSPTVSEAILGNYLRRPYIGRSIHVEKCCEPAL